jgi:dihydroorotase
MKLLIRNGRVIDPATGLDMVADVAVAGGRIIGIQSGWADSGNGFTPDRVLDAQGCIVAPGLVDLAVRLREPGQEHLGMLESEMQAAVAGGVTSLVCPPDTDPVLDEPGLVNMLKYRAEKLHLARVFPLGALTKGLKGQALTEMLELTDAGCVGFGQAEVPIVDTLVLQRTLQYAATFGYTVWLRPQDAWLGKGVAASGPLATRMGLSGVPVAAELIALHTLFELVRSTRARVHLCRISSAAGVELVRAAKAEGLPITCDVSVHNLHLIDVDLGYFDSRTRLSPPLRQQRDREALRAALADGTIDALVSDHTPVDDDAKALPFAEAEIGASAVELLLSLGAHWGRQGQTIDWMRVLKVLTHGPAQVLGSSLGTLEASVGRLSVGGVADLCIIHPDAWWTVQPQSLRSQGRHTPFAGQELPAVVRHTLVGGQVAFEREQAA